MFEGFPYTNFHELNLDWIIKIAKDFLDQYTHIQDTITQGLEDLDTKAQQLTALLDAWYNEHSEDIADQLADALQDLNDWYTTHQGYLNQYLTDSIAAFETAADEKAAQTIASIPEDYTELSNDVSDLQSSINDVYECATVRTLGSYATFVQGTLNQNGATVESDIRIRSGGVSAGLTKRYLCVINPGYKMRVFYYDETNNFVKFTDYYTDEIYTEIGYIFRVVIGKTDDSQIVPSEASDAYIPYSITPVSDELVNFENSVSNDLVIINNKISLLDMLNAETIPFKIGSTSAYIRADTGGTANSSNSERTDFVDISGYDYLVYSRLIVTASTTTAGIAFYETADPSTFIDGSGEYCLTDASDFEYVDSIIKIPDTANYVRLTLRKTLPGFYVKGIKSNPLKGLKLSVLGDSMTAYPGVIPEGNDTWYNGTRGGVTSVEEMWWKILCNNTGMIPWVIDGWSGSAICYNFATDSTHSDTNKIPMCSDLRTGRLAKDNVDPDIIIVAGGSNDWTYSKSTTTPLGEWDGRTGVDRTEVVSGQSTFIKSYASMIDKLHENYPGAIVVCASLYYENRGTPLTGGVTRVNDTGNTEGNYNEAIERVCKIMGVPYIDLYNVGFTYRSEEHTSELQSRI